MLNYLKIFSIKRFLSSLLQAFGVLWLIVEIANFFFGQQPWIDWFRENWWIFLAIGFASGIFRARPRLSMCYRLKGTDVDIEVRVKDIFRSNAAIIVGSNTTFDTSVKHGVISGASIQGQYTLKCFDTEEELEGQIAGALSSLTPANTRDQAEKNFGNLDEYEMGTTIAVKGKSRTAYLVAISRLNSHGAAEASDANFLDTLPRMWLEIRSKGGMENLDCPILGSGYSRLTMNRQELIFELIRSFIAATRDGKLAERITFHISRQDYVGGHVDLEKVKRFLEHECERLPVSRTNTVPTGTGI